MTKEILLLIACVIGYLLGLDENSDLAARLNRE